MGAASRVFFTSPLEGEVDHHRQTCDDREGGTSLSTFALLEYPPPQPSPDVSRACPTYAIYCVTEASLGHAGEGVGLRIT